MEPIEYNDIYTDHVGVEPVTARIDTRIESEKGKVLFFSLSLSYLKLEEKYEVYRVDTADHHDGPHEHLLWRDKNKIRLLQGHTWQNYGQLLIQTQESLSKNYLDYIKIYKEARGV